MKNMEYVQDLLVIEKRPHFYKIVMYGMSHSKLLLLAKILDTELHKRYYILCGEVKYFEGRMSWRGSGLELATDKEYKECWQKIYPMLTDDQQAMDDYFLLKSHTEEGYDVKLLVGTAYTSDKMFPDFERYVGLD